MLSSDEDVRHSEETKLKISESNKGKHQGLEGGLNYNAKKLINVFNQQVFGCVKEAAKFYNMSYTMLKYKLAGRIENNTYSGGRPGNKGG